MAYTIDDMLEIPYNTGLYNRITKNGISQPSNRVGGIVNVDGQGSYCIGWNSTNLMFQVQWRWMRRLVPTEAVLVDPSGGDVWYGWNGADLSSGTQGNRDEFGDWQGQDLTSETASPTMSWSVGKPSVFCYTNGGFPLNALEIAMPYDLTTYDLAVLQVRVRVFQTGGTVSEWGVSETTIGFAPTISDVTAELNDDGTLTITADTNLERAGNIISADGFVDNGTLMPGTAFTASSGADPSATVSVWPTGSNEVTIAGLSVATADGASTYVQSVTVAVTEPTPSIQIPEPSIGIDDNGTITVGASSTEVVDLTGTVWYLNAVLEPLDGGNLKNIDFKSNGSEEFVSIKSSSAGSVFRYEDSDYYSLVVYNLWQLDGWVDEGYRTIYITGGADVTDAALIEWLKANAVLSAITGYDSVRVRASYIDEEGNVYDELVPMTEDGDIWRGTIPTPPLDVPVTVTVVYTVGDDWDYTTQQITVPSDGRILLDWGNSHFALKYNVTRAYSNDLLGDTVSIAGKELPVSRYSTSRTVKMTVTGRIINPAKLPSVGDMWLGELNVLNEPHDWILRLPGGMRRRIAIETWVPQFDDTTCDTIADVTITANEVSV